MSGSTPSPDPPAGKRAFAGGIAAYLVATASLFPVLPVLYVYGAAARYHALTRHDQRGPTWRVEVFDFFSQGWWLPALGLIVGSLGLATLALAAARRPRRSGSRLAAATTRMALLGLGLGSLGALLLAELFYERFVL